MKPATVALVVLALAASVCSSEGGGALLDSSAAPSGTAAPTSSPSPVSTSTSTTTTSTTTTSTSTTTTSTTTTLPDTLDVDGSPLIEFSIEADLALDLDQDALVAFVIETLRDSRGWVGRGAGFRLVDDGGLFTIIVAEPARVDQLCRPLQTLSRYSCARNGWIAINSLRWMEATDDWPADLDTYRRYVINHEVGHYIVGPSHARCPGEGLPAPLMMQQTKGLHGCLPNGWVDPE